MPQELHILPAEPETFQLPILAIQEGIPINDEIVLPAVQEQVRQITEQKKLELIEFPNTREIFLSHYDGRKTWETETRKKITEDSEYREQLYRSLPALPDRGVGRFWECPELEPVDIYQTLPLKFVLQVLIETGYMEELITLRPGLRHDYEFLVNCVPLQFCLDRDLFSSREWNHPEVFGEETDNKYIEFFRRFLDQVGIVSEEARLDFFDCLNEHIALSDFARSYPHALGKLSKAGYERALWSVMKRHGSGRFWSVTPRNDALNSELQKRVARNHFAELIPNNHPLKSEFVAYLMSEIPTSKSPTSDITVVNLEVRLSRCIVHLARFANSLAQLIEWDNKLSFFHDINPECVEEIFYPFFQAGWLETSEDVENLIKIIPHIKHKNMAAVMLLSTGQEKDWDFALSYLQSGCFNLPILMAVYRSLSLEERTLWNNNRCHFPKLFAQNHYRDLNNSEIKDELKILLPLFADLPFFEVQACAEVILAVTARMRTGGEAIEYIYHLCKTGQTHILADFVRTNGFADFEAQFPNCNREQIWHFIPLSYEERVSFFEGAKKRIKEILAQKDLLEEDTHEEGYVDLELLILLDNVPKKEFLKSVQVLEGKQIPPNPKAFHERKILRVYETETPELTATENAICDKIIKRIISPAISKTEEDMQKKCLEKVLNAESSMRKNNLQERLNYHLLNILSAYLEEERNEESKIAAMGIVGKRLKRKMLTAPLASLIIQRVFKVSPHLKEFFDEAEQDNLPANKYLATIMELMQEIKEECERIGERVAGKDFSMFNLHTSFGINNDTNPRNIAKNLYGLISGFMGYGHLDKALERNQRILNDPKIKNYVIHGASKNEIDLHYGKDTCSSGHYEELLNERFIPLRIMNETETELLGWIWILEDEVEEMGKVIALTDIQPGTKERGRFNARSMYKEVLRALEEYKVSDGYAAVVQTTAEGAQSNDPSLAKVMRRHVKDKPEVTLKHTKCFPKESKYDVSKCRVIKAGISKK